MEDFKKSSFVISCSECLKGCYEKVLFENLLIEDFRFLMYLIGRGPLIPTILSITLVPTILSELRALFHHFAYI